MLSNISKRSRLPLAQLIITTAPFPVCGYNHLPACLPIQSVFTGRESALAAATDPIRRMVLLSTRLTPGVFDKLKETHPAEF